MYNYYDLIDNLKPDEVLDYLRKSRTDDPTLSVEEVLSKHETILDEWAVKNLGAKVPEENKFREVVSGETIADRPQIQKILKMIESPRFKAIKCYDVQRLSRGDLEDAGRLIKLLRYTNTIVITPQKIYDLRDEYDRDAFERELKRGNEYLEYTKKIMNNGRLLSVSQGNFIGNTAPYGYEKIVIMEGRRKCHTLAIKEEEANVVRMIFDLYVNKDYGHRTICNYLESIGINPTKGKYWAPATIRDMLANVHYTGRVRWNWRKVVTVVEDSEIIQVRPRRKMGDYLLYDGKHEAIISEELFNAAQEKHGKNTRTKAATKLKNPLAGLIFCQCGRAMIYRQYRETDGNVRCAPRVICSDQQHCNTGSCTFDDLMNVVTDSLKQTIEDFEFKIKNQDVDSAKLHEKHLKTLEKKLQELEAKELAQWEAQADPDPSQRMPAEIFKKLNEKLLNEKEEVRQAIQTARQSAPTPIDYAEKLAKLHDAINALSDPAKSVEEKNKLLRACVERIDYNRERPERTRLDFKSYDGWTTPPIEIDIKIRY